MEIKIEIADDTVMIVEEELKIKVEFLIQTFCTVILENMKNIATLKAAGVKLDLETVEKFGRKLGQEALRKAKEQAKENKPQ